MFGGPEWLRISRLQCRHAGYVKDGNAPSKTPLHPWDWPRSPWSRVNVDYAGPFQNHILLVISDAHTKWLEVYITKSSTLLVTIEKLRSTFAIFGVPQTLVSDNGTRFTSAECEQLIKRNGIRHVTSSPYHPATNEHAERGVQMVKRGLSKMTEGSLQTRLSRFLFHYRIMPHATTGIAPAELMFDRLIHSPLTCQVQKWVQQQKIVTIKRLKNVPLRLMIWFLLEAAKWIPGIIIQVKGKGSVLYRQVRKWSRCQETCGSIASKIHRQEVN